MMTKVSKYVKCAIVMGLPFVSACQTTSSYVPVSEASPCIDIVQSFNANNRQAKEVCGRGWEVAGPYQMNEYPNILIGADPDQPFVSPKKVAKFDLRYCTKELRSNYLQSKSAWQNRVCNAYPDGSYRHLNVEEAKAERDKGLHYMSFPPSEDMMRHFDYTVDDPILGCQGEACPD